MVSEDRGQILLVGAVAIAFVLLGLVAVYNAQLTTSGPTAAGSTNVAEAAELNREARRNVRAVTVRVNHREPYYGSPAALNDAVGRAVGNYSRLLERTYVGSSGAVVNVTYDGAARMGTRTVQSDNMKLTDHTGAPDWEPIDRSERREIGWFVLNLNATRLDDTTPFVITVYNGTGPSPATTTYEFTRNTTGSSVVNVAVTNSPPGVGTPSTTCNAAANRSLLDLKQGISYTSNCTFTPGTAALEGPYAVEFENGDEAVGKFALVTNSTRADRPNGLGDCPAAGEPCNTYAVWNATLSTRYESGTVSYSNTQNVTVYTNV